jgi:predicted nuclease of restriction endonuclease-like RecB superfamily
VPPLRFPTGAQELALRANLKLAQAIVFRATQVRIRFRGDGRRIVRHAKQRGLICQVELDGELDGQWTWLKISGPFGVLRHTLMYGRALGELIPILLWEADWTLEADVKFGERTRTLILRPGDALYPGPEPRWIPSLLEKRFLRDLARAYPEWEATCEPDPIVVGRSVIFPDLLLRKTDGSEEIARIEIAGFWTPDYLLHQLRKFRDSGTSRLVLCVDENRACGEEGLPNGVAIVAFRKRIDPAKVMEAIERTACAYV